MGTRPLIIPTWATDLNYTNPPEAATPTKTDPGAGKRAEGWLPSERPEPREWNHEAHFRGQWIDYLKDVELLNWLGLEGESSNLDNLTGTPTDAQNIAYHPDGGGSSGNPSWVFMSTSGSATQKFFRSNQGGHWEASNAHASAGNTAHSKGLIYSPTAGLWIAKTNLGVNSIFTSPDSLTWTARTDPDAFGGFRGAVVDNGSIIVAARDEPDFLSSVDGITWTSRSNPTSAMRGIAWSPSLGLFASVGSMGVAATSPDGITWTDRTSGVPGVPSLEDVIWDPIAAKFVAIAAELNGVVLTSADGITWTSEGSPFTTPTGATTIPRSLDTDGGGNIVAVTDNTVNNEVSLGHSNDGGATWRNIFPVLPFGPVNVQAIRYAKGRFVIAGANPTTITIAAPAVAFSLAMNNL
jgi:hypothetical protein